MDLLKRLGAVNNQLFFEPNRIIAERIRINVEQFNNGICPMTVSIGVTACKNEKYTETVRRADNALYRAKNSGRNKVEVE